jgi:hypothetical protein
MRIFEKSCIVKCEFQNVESDIVTQKLLIFDLICVFFFFFFSGWVVLECAEFE